MKAFSKNTAPSTIFLHAMWYALAIALAMVTVFNGLDRQSRRDPDLSGAVPAPFRSFAQENIVVDRLRSDAPQDALPEARKLVRLRPIPAENLLLLTAAYEAAGDIAQARATLAVSGSRGWRVVEVQRILALDALAQNLVDPAAARLLAMWSVDADRTVLAPLTARLFAANGGPEAFGRYVAQSRFSRDVVARQSLFMVAPEQYARMIRAATDAGAAFDCGILKRQARTLVQQGFPARAAEVSAFCSADAPARSS